MQMHLFEPEFHDSVLRHNFSKSELGRLDSTIPFRELGAFFRSGLRRKPQGVKAAFNIEGGLGLVFLKHHSNLSDPKLIERVNTDWHYQMFCGLVPKPDYGIKDKDMVGRWRRFFGKRMNLPELQGRLAASWKADLEHPQVSMEDATVYESYIKFPTDVKLLWDCTAWVHGTISKLCARHQLAMPRSKYKDQKIKQTSYSKQRKKTHKQERRRRKALLYLLEKLLQQLQCLLNHGRQIIEGVKPSDF